MPRLLIRAAKDPFLALTAEATYARNVIGNNAGNLLFGFAVHRALSVPGTEVVANAFLTERPGVGAREIARINDEFDAFVLPLANAFRPDFAVTLDRLAAVIEQLTIPVVVVGVGAQVSPKGTALQDEVKPAVTRFVRAVLDRSAVLGVRGEITAACLADLGFGSEVVDVIGCPSLYVHGREHRIARPVERLTADSPIAVNLTPTRPRMAAILDATFERYPRAVYVPQETRELGLMLWGQPPRGGEDHRFPLHLAHRAYAEDRVRFFVDPSTWEQFLARQHFGFGTRIHGTIAALAAGIPGFVLTFDSRTKELADYHAIPTAPLESVAADVDADELYQRADPEPFNRRLPEAFDHYVAFLQRNGLEHIWLPGKANPEFDARLAEVAFPPPVGTPFAAGAGGTEALLERLRWLRQGDVVDGRRAVGAHRPSFGRSGHDRPDLEDRVTALESKGRSTPAAPATSTRGGTPVRRRLGRLARSLRAHLP